MSEIEKIKEWMNKQRPDTIDNWEPLQDWWTHMKTLLKYIEELEKRIFQLLGQNEYLVLKQEKAESNLATLKEAVKTYLNTPLILETVLSQKNIEVIYQREKILLQILGEIDG